MSDNRGQLYKMFGVYCGRCRAEDVVLPPCDTFPEAREHAMEAGWKHTPKHGWCCPICLEEEK